MSKMTFHEVYGDVSVAQLRAYRKHNVSRSDHDHLTDVYGRDAHDAITAAVKEFSRDNIFRAHEMITAAQENGRI